MFVSYYKLLSDECCFQSVTHREVHNFPQRLYPFCPK